MAVALHPRARTAWLGLLRLSDGDKSSAEIGYSVVRAYRNRGIATEAVAALIGEGFHRARLQRIRAYCLPENHFSRAVLKRAGFETDGTLPRGATVQGRPVDVLTHILTCADWERTCHPERRAFGPESKDEKLTLSAVEGRSEHNTDHNRIVGSPVFGTRAAPCGRRRRSVLAALARRSAVADAPTARRLGQRNVYRSECPVGTAGVGFQPRGSARNESTPLYRARDTRQRVAAWNFS